MKTKVKFYVASYAPVEEDEQPHREVLAVFVDEVHDGYIDCYAHLGQHSTCSNSFLRENCRIASKEEYNDLFNELTNLVGYNLEVL